MGGGKIGDEDRAERVTVTPNARGHAGVTPVITSFLSPP